jgi:hypothetical protein
MGFNSAFKGLIIKSIFDIVRCGDGSNKKAYKH